MGHSRKTVIIGLDGATFDVLDPLMEQGFLPTLKRLRDTGISGPLESTFPPTTPPAWTSCCTGLGPGRHGIFDFLTSPLKNPAQPLVTSRSIQGRKLWHVFQDHQRRSIVLNVPVTYPPEPVHGCMISGMMTPDFESPFMYPPELKSRIKAVCGNYIPNIDIPGYDVSIESDAFRFLDDISEMLDRRREATRYLMENEAWDFFMVVFIGMDRIQHLFFKYLLPGSPLYDSPRGRRLRERILTEFRKLDDAVEDIVQRLDENTSLFIMSDHGFGPTAGYFNVNTWLQQNGFLAVKPFNHLKKKTFFQIKALGESRVVEKVLPAGIKSFIRKRIREGRSTLGSARQDLHSVIDWSGTKAFFASIPTQGIYIHSSSDNPRSPEEIDTIKRSLKSQLQNIKLPGADGPLLDDIWFREDIFSGPEMEFAPHLLFKSQNFSVLGRQHLGASSWFDTCVDQPIGFHRSDGIFIASGPGIRGGRIENARIIDIMPTCLYTADLPIPENLDGTVLTQIFHSDYAKDHEIRYYAPDSADAGHRDNTVYTEEESDAISSRLKSLGYLE